MKRRYTDEQIIKAIKKHEAGAKVEDICRDLGISNGRSITGAVSLLEWKLTRPSAFGNLRPKTIS